MNDLNDNEEALLYALVKESENYGHDFGITEDVKLPNGMTPKQFSGYMSQLVQKGYIEVEESNSYSLGGKKLPSQFVLTEKIPTHIIDDPTTEPLEPCEVDYIRERVSQAGDNDYPKGEFTWMD